MPLGLRYWRQGMARIVGFRDYEELNWAGEWQADKIQSRHESMDGFATELA